MNTKPLVIFRTLASDQTVCPIGGNVGELLVNTDAILHYMENMKELTGGTDVEFNNTFRALCKDRVFFTFEPVKPNYAFEANPTVPEVVECVLLTNSQVALNINGNVTIMYPEEGNCIYATFEDAKAAAKENALETVNATLDDMCAIRKEMRQALKDYNSRIDVQFDFKHSLGE